MKRGTKFALYILSAAAVIFAVYAFISIATKLSQARKDLAQTQAMFESERSQKERVREELGITREQVQKLDAQLKATQDKLDAMNTKLAGLQSDNENLTREKEKLEARLHSLKELKIAIREVKLDMHQKSVEQWLEKKKLQAQMDAIALAQGNRGFFVKDGQPYKQPSKVHIEVRPSYQ